MRPSGVLVTLVVRPVYSGVLNFLLEEGDAHVGDSVVSFVPMGGADIHDYAEPECQLLNEPAVVVAPANMSLAAGEPGSAPVKGVQAVRGSRFIAHRTGPPPGRVNSARTLKPKCSYTGRLSGLEDSR